MKKFIALFLSLMTAVSMTVTAGAAQVDSSLVPTDLLTDNAGILSSSEENKISKKLEKVSEKYDIDVLVYTTRDVPSDSEYACEIFANQRLDEYLYANDVDDAIMFVIDMDYRLWYIVTESRAKEAVDNSYGITYFEDELVDYLSDGDYEECFIEYAELCDEFFKALEEGDPYSDSNPIVTAGMIIKALLIGAVIGLIVALIVTSVLKKQLKSVDMQKTANNFVRRGSFNVKLSQDLFLFKNVTKTRRQSSSSGGGRSGGSRGGSRGGGGGRF